MQGLCTFFKLINSYWSNCYFNTVSKFMSLYIANGKCVTVINPSLHWIWHCTYFFFWPRCTACGILVPRTGIEHVPPALEAWSLNHWTTREVPLLFKKILLLLFLYVLSFWCSAFKFVSNFLFLAKDQCFLRSLSLPSLELAHGCIFSFNKETKILFFLS